MSAEAALAIVGAGPAGLSAAIAATEAGVDVTVLDDNPRPGGQIYRQIAPGLRVTDQRVLGKDHERGQALLDEFRSLGARVRYLEDAVVWGVFPGNALALARGGDSEILRYRALVVALGAYDRPVLFPGWTLPGVFTAGGAQRLVKTQRVLPGDDILLAGTGPMPLALANQIVDAGGKVAAILEAGDIDSWTGLAVSARGQWGLLADARRYWSGIRKAGIPLLRRHIIVEAHGDGRVEEAVVAGVDPDWRVIPGTRRTLPVDTVCVGYGFVPSLELTRAAGCEHRYEPLLGGWIPVLGETMETSVAGIFAAGDCTGVAGSLVAAEEGRIAGLAAARALGALSAEEATRRMAPSRRRLAGLRRLRRKLDALSVPRAGLYELATDATIACRCEELTLGEVKAVLTARVTDVNEVKRLTRAGMGRCQGRMCGPALQEIIAREKGLPPEAVGSLHVRPPVRPVPLTALARRGELE